MTHLHLEQRCIYIGLGLFIALLLYPNSVFRGNWARRHNCLRICVESDTISCTYIFVKGINHMLRYFFIITMKTNKERKKIACSMKQLVKKGLKLLLRVTRFISMWV